MKYLLIFAILCIVSRGTQAQFFSNMKHPLPRTLINKQGIRTAVVTLLDSTFNAIRPIVSTAFEIPSFRAMAGTGISFQHITYTYATQRFYCHWSLSAMAWVGGTIPPATFPAPPDPNTFVSYGIQGGILNNNVTVGISVNHKKPQLTAGWTYNFNN